MLSCCACTSSNLKCLKRIQCELPNNIPSLWYSSTALLFRYGAPHRLNASRCYCQPTPLRNVQPLSVSSDHLYTGERVAHVKTTQGKRVFTGTSLLDTRNA